MCTHMHLDPCIQTRAAHREAANSCGIGCLYLLCWQYDYVRARYDWHTLPGVTEEWRTDAIPKGHSKDSNRCGGATCMQESSRTACLGVSAFHMLPHPDDETGYTVVSANKAYFFLDFGVVALGNSITRLTSGQGRPIVTTLDQARWRSDITYQVGNGGSPTTLPFSIGGGLRHERYDRSRRNCVVAPRLGGLHCSRTTQLLNYTRAQVWRRGRCD